MVPVQWSLVSGDAFQKDPSVIIRRVENKVRNGSIIVMHLNGAPHAPETYDALVTLISWLKDHGYTMVTLNDLLN
jgi:peptidoglycan/xylan/chitin deacetylase (PgdA/CDA1 family)